MAKSDSGRRRRLVSVTIVAVLVIVSLLTSYFYLTRVPRVCESFIDKDPRSMVPSLSDVGDDYALDKEWEMFPPPLDLWETGYSRTFNSTSNADNKVGFGIYWFNSVSLAKQDFSGKVEVLKTMPNTTFQEGLDFGDEAAMAIETGAESIIAGLMFREENVISIISLKGSPSFADADLLFHFSTLAESKIC